jgi:hypothetical protein
MLAQRFSQRETNQPGAIALLRFPFIADSIELHFSDCSEPPAEVLPIIKRPQFSFVWNAIGIGIFTRRYDPRGKVVSLRGVAAPGTQKACDQQQQDVRASNLH